MLVVNRVDKKSLIDFKYFILNKILSNKASDLFVLFINSTGHNINHEKMKNFLISRGAFKELINCGCEDIQEKMTEAIDDALNELKAHGIIDIIELTETNVVLYVQNSSNWSY